MGSMNSQGSSNVGTTHERDGVTFSSGSVPKRTESDIPYKSFFENSATAMGIFGEDSVISLVNHRFELLSGYTKEEIEGKTHWYDFVPEEDRVRMAKYHDMRSKGEGSPPSEYDFSFIHKSGEVRWVHIKIGLEPMTKNRLFSLIDITRRKRIEESLGLRQAYFRSLFENAPEAIVLADNEGIVIDINREFTKLFGFLREEAVGNIIDDLVVPEQEIDAGRRRTKRTVEGKREGFETKRLRKSGGLIDVSVVTSPIYVNGEQVGIYGIYRDISGRKRAEREVLNERERAEFYLDLLSHDIGNLHQGIYTGIQLSKLKMDDPKGMMSALSTSEELVNRSMQLVRNVLFLSNLKSMETELKPVDLTFSIESSYRHIPKLFPKKKIEMEFERPKERVMIMAEPLVEELFFNLLHNAVKFQTGKDARVEMSLSCDQENNRVAVNISDWGPGISEEVKERIYSKFTKAGDMSRTGLGLSLVKALADRYDGTIEVKDRVRGDRSKGTTFCIEFEIADQS